jgi:hypothetical protein
LAKKGCSAVRLAVVDVVADDFSALTFILFSSYPCR